MPSNGNPDEASVSKYIGLTKSPRLILIKRIEGQSDPINPRSPEEIVKSVPSIWSRVSIAIFNVCHYPDEFKNSMVNQDHLVVAMFGTDVVVYVRNEATCETGDPLAFAIDLLKRMMPKSKK